MKKLTKLHWHNAALADTPIYVNLDKMIWMDRTVLERNGERINCTAIAMGGFSFHVRETPEEILAPVVERAYMTSKVDQVLDRIDPPIEHEFTSPEIAAKAARLLRMDDDGLYPEFVQDVKSVAASALTQVRGGQPAPRSTGVTDKNGREIFEGDRVLFELHSKDTKREYWDPEYEVIWDAPRFTLKHVGGGKDGGSHDFILKYGGSNGQLVVLHSKVPEHPFNDNLLGDGKSQHILGEN